MFKFINLNIWWIVVVVSVIHLTCAIGYLFNPAVLQITSLSLSHLVFGNWLPIILASAGIIALIPIVIKLPVWFNRLLLFPQQFMLFLAAYSILSAAVIGMYPDGTTSPTIDFSFIFSDQCAIVYLMIIHFYTLFLKD